MTGNANTFARKKGHGLLSNFWLAMSGHTSVGKEDNNVFRDQEPVSLTEKKEEI